MEIFDLYDKHGQLLGKTMERGHHNQEGEYHLVTHIWIRNSKGQYLIQQRNKLTDEIPFQWACTGGAVLAGETSIEATIRETHEELGILLKAEDFIFLKRYVNTDPHANFLTDLYLIKKDIPLEDLKIDEIEVKDVAYHTMEEIEEMIAKEEFWDYKHRLQRPDYFAVLEKS
ncbi:MAG TPA: NUDIX domain-containing protein [Bacillota bacterium]|nr:NUDIX domain-containing protein [Bacillota bacterium]HPJ24018.1 NUDIX domain-containing protein [Bacillota bacterium]